MQYYIVPAAILEDSDELIAWAGKSVVVSRAQCAQSDGATTTRHIKAVAPAYRPR